MSEKLAVVTGASSGIGAASARALAEAGFKVICAARRVEALEALAAEIEGIAVACDITSDESVATLAEVVAGLGGGLQLLVNNAGGAVGLEPLADSNIADWETMFSTNVIGTARVTKALLPSLEAGKGTIIFITSTAAEDPYENAGGYTGAKVAERYMAGALRLELNGRAVRICEISPGMVHTEGFSLTRFRGDQARADAVYANVENPLLASDIADAVTWVATRPAHVNIDRLVVRPVAQASNHKTHRGPLT
jgi:NADP-dependent 3-hydroxy acid dehydrogenase YdfG